MICSQFLFFSNFYMKISLPEGSQSLTLLRKQRIRDAAGFPMVKIGQRVSHGPAMCLWGNQTKQQKTPMPPSAFLSNLNCQTFLDRRWLKLLFTCEQPYKRQSHSKWNGFLKTAPQRRQTSFLYFKNVLLLNHNTK